MRHVKPHGALYNMAAADEQLARAICGAVKDFDPELRLVGLSGSLLIRAAEKTGLRAISEVFADRSYEADGSLVSRRKPGAIISDEREALRRVIRMVKEGKVKAINGEEIAIRAESVCVHGDGEKALLFAKSIREALTANDIQVSPA